MVVGFKVRPMIKRSILADGLTVCGNLHYSGVSKRAHFAGGVTWLNSNYTHTHTNTHTHTHRFSSLLYIFTSVKCTIKHVLSGHSKIEKTKILMTNCGLMEVERLQNAPLGAFCNTFHLHLAIIGIEKQFWCSF